MTDEFPAPQPAHIQKTQSTTIANIMSSAWKPHGSLGALQAKPRSVEKMRNNHQNLGVRESCDAVSLTWHHYCTKALRRSCASLLASSLIQIYPTIKESVPHFFGQHRMFHLDPGSKDPELSAACVQSCPCRTHLALRDNERSNFLDLKEAASSGSGVGQIMLNSSAQTRHSMTM